MFFLDEEFRVTRVAGSFADWLGVPSESLIGKKITTLVTADTSDSLTDTLTAVHSSQTTQIVTCEFAVDGRRGTVDVELAPLSDAPELGTILGTIEQQTIPDSDRERGSHLVELQNFIEVIDGPCLIT